MILNFQSHASKERTSLAWARMRHVRSRIDRAAQLPDDSDPADVLLILMLIAPFVLLGSFASHVT